MDPVLLITIIAALLYAGLSMWVGFNLSPRSDNPPPDYVPQLPITVVIPFRNEAQNLPYLLSDLNRLEYPDHLLDVIFIDDHSSDDGPSIITYAGLQHSQLLKLEDPGISNGPVFGKKAALEAGIKKADTDWIVTTDADCRIGGKWLSRIAWQQEATQAKCIVGPVGFSGKNNLFGWLQRFDQMGMTAYTAAGLSSSRFHMGGGANLSFSKQAYHEAGGYSGHDKYASGDDVFLIQAIAEKYPKGITFLMDPHAMVVTPTIEKISSFIQQRIRWGNKAKAFRENSVKLVLGYQFLYSCIICAFFLAAFSMPDEFLVPCLVLITVKGMADLIIVRKIATTLDMTIGYTYLVPSILIHPWYLCVVGIMANILRNYTWKDRRLR